jgi:hypothetical protein
MNKGVIKDFLSDSLIEFDEWGVESIELVEIYRMVPLVLLEPVNGRIATLAKIKELNGGFLISGWVKLKE